MKTDQSTIPSEIDPLSNKNNLTIIERYVFASHWCKGKTVLDAATGYGYGAAMVNALGAKSVSGCDIDEDALKHCKKNHKGLAFFNKDLTRPVQNGNEVFDTVLSIETMEHLPKNKVSVYLKNLKKYCKPNGIVLITTPLRKLEKFEYNGGTHLYEYNEKELLPLLKKVFNCVKLYSIAEFKINREGLLHSELFEGINKNSNLFFVICSRKEIL